jgi:hypothetical protein
MVVALFSEVAAAVCTMRPRNRFMAKYLESSKPGHLAEKNSTNTRE